jgi:hypothetical protein
MPGRSRGLQSGRSGPAQGVWPGTRTKTDAEEWLHFQPKCMAWPTDRAQIAFVSYRHVLP